eukprot:4821286-Lingulodinium_polyedra.AAC.2
MPAMELALVRKRRTLKPSSLPERTSYATAAVRYCSRNRLWVSLFAKATHPIPWRAAANNHRPPPAASNTS